MKIINVEQGTAEWLEARRGIPSASDFHKIVTPTGKLSKQAREFAFKLIAEKLLGESVVALDGLQWIERGKMLEPDAAAMYEFQTGKKTIPTGFITNDAVTLGCSPDRFTDNGAILEIKCPAPQTHIQYMIDGFDIGYKPQVQGQLYITDLQVNEWFSYHPELPPVHMVIERDEEYIKLLHEALTEFVALKNKLLEEIRAKGLFDEREALAQHISNETGV